MAIALDLKNYNWNQYHFTEGTSKYDRYQKLVEATKPDLLASYISEFVPGGDGCHVEDLFTHGGSHLVRMVTLPNGQRWIARFRIPGDESSNKKAVIAAGARLMQREVDCLTLMSQKTTVPVPRVMYHRSSCDKFGTSFTLMECLPGNCAMDIHFEGIPGQYKAVFFKQMANAQVQMSNLLFPMIGSVSLVDGKVTIGPIPGIGGPFRTATDFFQAWAATAEFGLSDDRVREGAGSCADELLQSTHNFPKELSRLADRICAKNNLGPFPLLHVDFGHSNMIVDPEYNILGVIDWEHAYAAPWETVDYPVTIWRIPPPIDVPSDYENGWPKDERTRALYRDRDHYLEAVKQAEKELNIPPRLSDILSDTNVQDVATGMRFFSSGKMGYYTRVLDPFQGAE